MKRFSIVAIALALLLSSAFAGPVSHFGMLKVCGSNICGEKTGNTALMLKGPSLFWSTGSGASFYNQATVDWFFDTFQIGVIRAAMGIQYDNSQGNADGSLNIAGGTKGYYYDKAGQKSLIKAVIDAAISNDIYVIVDWHSHRADQETSLARDFFVEMANEYKNTPNIIWEVYNEPVNISTGQVSSHAKTITDALRNAGNKNLVLIGSPQWSSQPDQQASNWGNKADAETKNVAFTVHFYAATGAHDAYRGKADNARSSGYAVFASEWGFSAADGKGSVSNGSSWISWMDQNNISGCTWSISALESSSLLKDGTNSANLSESSLSTAGGYFRTYMNSKKWTSYIPSSNPKGNDATFNVNDGETATFSASQLGLTGTITEVKSRETFPVEVSNTANSITYKADGSQKGKVVLIYKVSQNNITIQSKITVNINNRLPVVPIKDPIQVSRKAQTTLNLTNDLGVADPEGTGIQLVSASVSPATAGTAAASGTNIVFTPAAGADGTDATLSYTVKNSKGNRTGTVTLKIRNMAPTIRNIDNTFSPSVPNTAPVNIDIDRFSGKDADGDDIWFDKIYLDPQYPGTLTKVSDKLYTYTPDASKTGKVTFLAVITDGAAKSPTGRANITLTGSGTEINVTPPTSIPNVVDPPVDPPVDPDPPVEPVPVYKYNPVKSMGLSSLGLGKIELYFANSGFAKLDVYSLSGKKMGNLLNGHQNAGSKEVSLKGLNLQRGVYILRLSQGSQVKILRVVN